ncbi:MAG: iron chaperone [Chitinophagaceae bacterium]
MPTRKPASIDDYIAGFPKETQTVLNQVRDTIKNAVPEAEETISYAIPAFILNKTYLVYFAGYKHHISLYPAPKGNEAFEKEIAGYRSGKGTIQFPLDKPLPLALVTKIVRYNLKENLKRQKDH